ncbi:MAG TPA: divalent-cation tolerance protein CutA [Vicinamibacterales bacterium]|nr:divalent-cation tolerance protein CutA [Vicinamibacterales bacterium]
MTPKSPTGCIVVLTTLPREADATAVARGLVEDRVAACVNILPEMTSIYTWEGRIEQEPERQLLIKTTEERLPALWTRLRQRHPYQVPEFLVVPVIDGNEAYLRWVAESVTPAAASDAGG